MKNRIRNMGIKRATLEHMFANLHMLWTGQLFTSLAVSYTISLNGYYVSDLLKIITNYFYYAGVLHTSKRKQKLGNTSSV